MFVLAAAVVLPHLPLASGAQAAEPLSSWSWSGSVSGGAVSGTAAFSLLSDGPGWDLIVDVSNTAPTAPVTTAQMLTGLYFDISPSASALSMLSAVATSGVLSSTNQTSPNAGSAGTNICAPGSGGTAASPACGATVPGGWELAYSRTGLASGVSQQWGIGTSGQSGVFNGNSRTGVGNADYGIAPGNGVGDGNGGGLVNMTPYTYSVAEFVLSGLTSDQITISNVEGTYGTQPEGVEAALQVSSPPNTVLTDSAVPAPEPASLALLLAGCLGLGAARYRRRAATGGQG